MSLLLLLLLLCVCSESSTCGLGGVPYSVNSSSAVSGALVFMRWAAYRATYFSSTTAPYGRQWERERERVAYGMKLFESVGCTCTFKEWCIYTQSQVGNAVEGISDGLWELTLYGLI